MNGNKLTRNMVAISSINKRHYCLLHIGLFTLIVLLSSIYFTSSVSAEDVAGKTLLAHGNVFAKRTTGKVTLKRRSKLFTNDEIHVGKGGRAQFRMKDKAIISLEENSVLKIIDYRFNDKSKKDSAVLELLSGGFRTITGAIGKKNKKDYELRTPLATIGIRGTGYWVLVRSKSEIVHVDEGKVHIFTRSGGGGCNNRAGIGEKFQTYVIKGKNCTGFRSLRKAKAEAQNSGGTGGSGDDTDNTGDTGDDTGDSGDSEDNEDSGDLASDNTSSNYKVSDASDDVLDPTITAPTPSSPYPHSGFVLRQSQPSQQTNTTVSNLDTSTPNIQLDLTNDLISGNGTVTEFQQNIGGFPVSWGKWGDASTVARSASQPDSLIWVGYDATSTALVSDKTGTVQYNNVTHQLTNSSQGAITNLQAQMDVNFTSGAVTNGALSAGTSNGSTPIETWVAVFNGQLNSGNLDLTLNGASVIDANPSTPSLARPASGYIEGDMIGTNAQAILGAFGLSEDSNTSNHIEGVFIVEPTGSTLP